MKTITIYKSYGVLAHEKAPFYSIGCPASDIYDTINVAMPCPTWENAMGEIGVTLDGVDYLLHQVLTNRADKPVLSWFNGQSRKWLELEIMPE